MRLVFAMAFVALADASLGWRLFVSDHRTPALVDVPHDVPQSPLQIDPTAILETAYQKPNFYAAAMLEIKRLEEKPLCHRAAAQLLVQSCQGMRDLKVHEYQVVSESMQRHHVESFAASLAICDMERARFDIPEACQPFGYKALEHAIRRSGKLEVTAQEVLRCLEGLGQDHSHWSTWLSYRDTSLLLCRGASVDVGKDQAIEFQKHFIRMMDDFTTNLHDDLENLRKQMAATSRDATTIMNEQRKQADGWKRKMHENFDTVAGDLKSTGSAVKSILVSTDNASQMLRSLVTTMLQSNAEMAAEQEQAISTTSRHVKSSFEDVYALVARNEAKISQLDKAIGQVTDAMSTLLERQSIIEKSSQITLISLTNATELIIAHGEKLLQASAKADKISEDIDKAALNAAKLGSYDSGLSWGLRTVIPVIFLIGGNFKTQATVSNNLMLIVMGYCTAEMTNFLRRLIENSEEIWSRGWILYFFGRNTSTPSISTQTNYKGRFMRSAHPNYNSQELMQNSGDDIETPLHTS